MIAGELSLFSSLPYNTYIEIINHVFYLLNYEEYVMLS